MAMVVTSAILFYGDFMKSWLALLAIYLSVFVVSLPRAEAQTELVRMNDYPGFGNLLGRVAVANKYCEKYGIRCELTSVNTAPIAMQTLLSGGFEVAYVPPEVAIQAAAKGAQLKAIGGGHILPPFFLIARDDLELPELAKGYPAVMQDFRGKKIGVSGRGAGPEFYLVELLKGAGMTRDDISIIVVGQPPTAYAALVNKQVEAIMTTEPAGAFCSVLKTCRVVVDPRKGEGPPSLVALTGATTPMFARVDFVRDKPQVIAAFQKAMRDADAYIQEPANFAAVKRIVEQTYKLDYPQSDAIMDAALKALIPGYRFTLKPKALRSAADYLVSSGQMSKPFDTSVMLLKH